MSNHLDEAWNEFIKNSPDTLSEEYKNQLKDIYMAGAKQFAYHLTKSDSTIGFIEDLVGETCRWVEDWNARYKEAKNAKVANPEVVPDPQTSQNPV